MEFKRKERKKQVITAMPFLGREKGRSPKSRRSDDEFVVFLQGVSSTLLFFMISGVDS